MADTHLIGLDWGTTQLRVYRFIADGAVAESRQLPAGILRLAADGPTAGFDRAFEEACGDWWRGSPASAILACGMIGSAQGWREAPYLDIPTNLDALGHALTEVSTRSGALLHIIPGLIERGPLPEVMRGEETQVAGAVDGDDAAPTPPGSDTWFGLPGTHTKWVRVRDRSIVAFHTFMTGEIFAALCDHTILGRTMRRPPTPDRHPFDRGVEVARSPEGRASVLSTPGHHAFDRGVEVAHSPDGRAGVLSTPDHHAFDRGVEVARSPEGRAGVLSTIFSARTLGLVGALSAEAQPDYLSGLLIGHELAAVEHLIERVAPLAPIVLVGSDELCQRYRRALAASGRAAAIAPAATERGLWRVATSAGLVPRSPIC